MTKWYQNCNGCHYTYPVIRTGIVLTDTDSTGYLHYVYETEDCPKCGFNESHKTLTDSEAEYSRWMHRRRPNEGTDCHPREILVEVGENGEKDWIEKR